MSDYLQIFLSAILVHWHVESCKRDSWINSIKYLYLPFIKKIKPSFVSLESVPAERLTIVISGKKGGSGQSTDATGNFDSVTIPGG